MKKCSQEKFISTIRNFVTRGLKKDFWAKTVDLYSYRT
jgi:hypothetical protein